MVALIRTSDRKVMFSTAADDIVRQINLTSNAVLQTVQVAGVSTGLVVSTFETSRDGVDYLLLVATYLDSSFLTSVADVHSLDLRLYLANPAGFSEIFSTQRFANHPRASPRMSRPTCAAPSSPASSSLTSTAVCIGRFSMMPASCKA